MYQNLYSVDREGPKYVVVLAGDHVYKMDYLKMLRFHQDKDAAVTLAAIEVPIEDGKRFGIVAIDESERVIGFAEKPADPPSMPGQPDLALASMGIYVFNSDVLIKALEEDAAQARQPARLRPQHHPQSDRHRTHVRLCLLRREQEGSEVLARHRHHRRLLRSQHGSLPGES